MPLTRQEQRQARDAAHTLQQLLSRPSSKQLLQRPPPAAPLTAEQAAFATRCCASLEQLGKALPFSGAASDGQILHVLLSEQAACSVGTLLAWLQQRPQQLRLAQIQVQATPAARNTLKAVWVESTAVFLGMTVASNSMSASEAAPLVVELTQQLQQSGLLRSLQTDLLPLLRSLIKQQQEQPQQVQQLQVAVRKQNGPFACAFTYPCMLLRAWEHVVKHAPAVLPSVLPTLPALLQQLQGCSRLLLQLPQYGGVQSPVPGSSRGTRAGAAGSSMKSSVVEFHGLAAGLLCTMVGLSEQVTVLVGLLAQHEEVEEMLLQLLTACTVLLHKEHTTQQQQQHQARVRPGNSGSSSYRQELSKWSPKVSADLLPIPAFHQDMLQLLPGGQAYLDGAAAYVADYCSTADQQKGHCWLQVYKVLFIFSKSLRNHLRDNEPLASDAPVLSAAALRLVLELQLLAAGELQRLQQATGPHPSWHRFVAEACYWGNTLLHLQTRAVLQAGASCLPPEVLQEAGLQLLQALAAPLQQLLSSSGSSGALLRQVLLGRIGMQEQLYAVRAAAAGLDLSSDQWPPAGRLPALAAAHPQAYIALIDCCLRSPAMEAMDMLAAADMLTHAADAVLGSPAALTATALPAGLASALTSLVKRAVQFTKKAVSLQAQPAEAAAAAARNIHARADACFPVAVLKITSRLYTRLADNINTASLHCQPQHSPSGGGGSGGSSSSSNQAAASVVLLAVVLARSLVQLADAMEAAGPQLLLQSFLGQPLYGLSWCEGVPGDIHNLVPRPYGTLQQHTAEVQWHFWQMFVLQSALRMLSALGRLELDPATQSAVAASTAAAAAAAVAPPAGSSTSGSCSSSNSQVSWGYLLQLQQSSPRWAAAVAAFDVGGLHNLDLTAAQVLPGNPVLNTVRQQYTAAIQLCRTLVAEAPLPVVCNNPSCENLAGVSEAAAASKACAGCRCRYCSAACQTADWKRHKSACKRMAAAGQACV
uniref:MYND-type domain-containing protein n=1 Tax=Tetradesmus obliquus TaxID=3088 RepID=A0A383V4W0_TETOB|eukprot:jgi/Sobl393_1/16250/SZX60645.1